MNNLKNKPDQPEVSPDREKAAGQAINDRWQRGFEQYVADVVAEMRNIIADGLSYDTLVQCLAQVRVSLRNEKAMSAAQREWASANFSAGWEYSEQLAINKEREPRKKGAGITNKPKADAKEWTQAQWERLKHQYPRGKGFNKTAFATYITTIPKSGSKSPLRNATGVEVCIETITEVWLKGL